MDIETGMMIAFILALIFSGWKMYAFLPNKPLEDDDRTDEADVKLNTIMLATIIEHYNSTHNLNNNELYTKMKEHEDFDHDKFWRFNPNRLNQLLGKHSLNFPNQDSIEKIYDHHKEKL
ncbi:MAG: hypothetical protein U9P71_09845 [Campylobacterota bacterium]|nr:hypothetical protein [Campylobacterota bacterium]